MRGEIEQPGGMCGQERPAAQGRQPAHPLARAERAKRRRGVVPHLVTCSPDLLARATKAHFDDVFWGRRPARSRATCSPIGARRRRRAFQRMRVRQACGSSAISAAKERAWARAAAEGELPVPALLDRRVFVEDPVRTNRASSAAAPEWPRQRIA
jgi:hypothetical protein